MKNSNKILSIMLVVIMVVSMLPMSVFADEPTSSWDISVSGDGSVMANWYNDTKTLIITGSGAMKSYLSYYATRSDYNTILTQVKTLIIEEGITKIGDYAFYHGTSEYLGAVCTTISLPSTLEIIGKSAFSNAASTVDIIIPNSITSVGVSAFAETKFKSVTFENGVSMESIDLGSFGDSLTSLVLPEGITSVTGSTYLPSLKYYVIPSTVTSYSGVIRLRDQTSSVKIYNNATTNQTVSKNPFTYYRDLSSSVDTQKIYQYSANSNFETKAMASNSKFGIHYLDTTETSGDLENGVTWSYDNNTRTLSFSGDGDIPNYSNGSQPWYGAASTGGVSSYSFGSGITGIGTGVFGYYGGSGTWGSNGNYNGVSTYSQPSLASSIASLAPGASNSTGEPIFGDADNEVGNAGEDGTTYIIVDANTTIFKASVPIKITVNQIADGSVSVPGPYTIDNLCPAGPIVVTDVRLQMKTNWSIADYTDDFANKLASSPILGLQMNENNFATNGSYTMPSSVSSSILHGESKTLTFNAKLPAQKTPIVNENIAAIIFTLDFDKVQ